jgi:hypothetical protein
MDDWEGVRVVTEVSLSTCVISRRRKRWSRDSRPDKDAAVTLASSGAWAPLSGSALQPRSLAVRGYPQRLAAGHDRAGWRPQVGPAALHC